MYDDQDAKYKKVFGELKSVDIEKYLLIIGAKEVEEIKRLSILLQGKTWCHVNSTFEGGGVAEMLKSIVPIAKGLGVNCKWYCIEGNKNFYSITKRLHNIFQGLEQAFTIEDLLETYLETNKNNFENKQIISDVTVVHDPQPCA
jgi:trehalose synthase